MNRLEGINFDMDPKASDYNMDLLLDKLQGNLIVPEPNKYYTFLYQAKTPRIQYDAHPVILSGSMFQGGFTGYNIHWNAVRRYDYRGVLSNLYELSEGEFESLKDVPLARFRTT